MTSFRTITYYAGSLLLALICTTPGAQERAPINHPPSRDPQELQRLLDLDDTQFNNAVQENDGARFRSIVSAFDPPGTHIFPISHGFASARQICLAARNATACRFYVRDLLAIQRERQDAAEASNNPFTTR